MQIIGMQIIYDYPGRSGSWHKADRSSRLVEAGVRSWFWSYSSRLEPRAEGRSAKTGQSLLEVRYNLKRPEQEKRGERGACERIRKIPS